MNKAKLSISQLSALARLADSATHHADFQRRYTQATYFVLPVIERLALAHPGMSILEIGCGYGAKMCALAPSVVDYLGIEIDSKSVAQANANLRRMGIPNARAIHLEANEIERVLEGSRFTLVLLYAVIEHLTLVERQKLLHRIWETLPDNGHIYVGEAPNLAGPVDYHSSRLPYFHMLAIEQRAALFELSNNESWKHRVRGEASIECGLWRNGGHVSFFDFHQALMPIEQLDRHIVFDNFDVAQFCMNPFRLHEAHLLQELAHNATDPRLDVRWPVPRCFSRYWIDFILSKTPVRTKFSDYPTLGVPLNVVRELLPVDQFRCSVVEIRPSSVVRFLNPGPRAKSAIIGFSKAQSSGTLKLFANDNGMAAVVNLDAEISRYEYWNPIMYVEVAIDIPFRSELILESDSSSHAAISMIMFFRE